MVAALIMGWRIRLPLPAVKMRHIYLELGITGASVRKRSPDSSIRFPPAEPR
jgi:hypothetical protein